MSEPHDLEARKNELFATITLLAGVKRDLLAARGARRLALIERQAQLEADKERLSHEVNSQYMYRNLQAFMTSVEETGARISNELGGLKDTLQAEFRSGIAGIQATVSTLAETVDGMQTQLHENRAGLAALQADFTAYVAGSKREEYEQRLRVLEADRGEYTPEERAELIGSLMDLLAWWKATHGDGI